MSRFEWFLYSKVRSKLGISIYEKNRSTLFVMLMILVYEFGHQHPQVANTFHFQHPIRYRMLEIGDTNIDVAEELLGTKKTCRVCFKRILEHLSQKSLIWISNSVPFMTDSKFKAFCYFKRWYRDTSVLLDVQINEEFRIFSKILLLRFKNAEVFV